MVKLRLSYKKILMILAWEVLFIMSFFSSLIICDKYKQKVLTVSHCIVLTG